MAAPKLTREQIERACAMRERGHSHAWIALRLGCSPGAVAWHCLKEGADPPNARPLDPAIRGPLVVMRGGFPVRRFTLEDDAILLAMSLAGETHSAIARALGRRHNSIKGRLMTLARHEARREDRP